MWLRQLRVQNLKRLRDFTLDLRREDGSTRMWTILIGRNGTGKTSILQAAALAAAGNFYADNLVQDMRESLPDKRLEKMQVLRGGAKLGVRTSRAVSAEVQICADFMSGPKARNDRTVHPLKSADDFTLLNTRGEGEWIRSRLWIRSDERVAGSAAYVDRETVDVPGRDRTMTRDRVGTVENDPIVRARQEELEGWFVVGYGVQRDLPETALVIERPKHPSVDRLRPLFGPRQLIGPNFQALFGSEALSRAYAKLLREVLLRTDALVPGITDIELRGKGGVTKASHLTESHRFEQEVAGTKLKLPARWLSHGYQSSLAWISDLVGQVVLEAGTSVLPQRMEGLVLIDEIDLYLHPMWQVGLIQALRDTLPNMQFIATTHSPILLTAFHRDEVVMLDYDDAGNVVQLPTPRDPRLLTGSELYEFFFGIDRLYPTELGQKVELYVRLARNPFRSDEDDAAAASLREELREEGITNLAPPSPRRQRPAAG